MGSSQESGLLEGHLDIERQLGTRGQGLGFRIWSLGFRIQGLE